ncbi:MAG: hypothetical protein WCJ30_14195, partial [Deltaproteobacteria bacterium]
MRLCVGHRWGKNRGNAQLRGEPRGEVRDGQATVHALDHARVHVTHRGGDQVRVHAADPQPCRERPTQVV